MCGMDHSDTPMYCILTSPDSEELHLVTKATIDGVGCGTESVRFEISPAPEPGGIQYHMLNPVVLRVRIPRI